MAIVSLVDLPHAEARALLASGAPVYLSINPVEYHGPHLSLHDDRLVSRGLIGDLHAALHGCDVPCLVASNLGVGVDPCPGPGSRHTPLRVVSALASHARALDGGGGAGLASRLA